ncbi:adenosylcobinamide-GDP ribazoletransferase [Streptomyces sp. NBS 14/10]|uniref:adenosylcobinamide-GDP ribazoletransferase n=1 Tax=Streptomyces sp. NBS 14/10 TaxID=1945643 RepID=UPI000B9CF4F0|nr:adenosylcobinamide-GDP ribazoletransferase [Streptomyces sp. NBS 14/10]KAK1178602.1 adenosylcobinamide-GDP ribazoletransferase [Streptomyces sp. NBS 14/10]
MDTTPEQSPARPPGPPGPSEPPRPTAPPRPAAPPEPTDTDRAATEPTEPDQRSEPTEPARPAPPSNPPPPPHPPRASWEAGVRFAFGTLTALPVRVTRWDREAARAGMLCAPLAGLTVGLCAASVGAALLLLGGGALLAAVGTVAVPAVLTRGLHLDGLADTADGLGSGKPADDALRIMKQSDIGPFGVITLLFVLFAQVAALAELYGAGWPQGAVAAATAGVAARCALTLAARDGVPAARPEGLGAAVAGSVPTGPALGAAAVSLVVCAVGGAAFGAYGAVHHALAVLAALGAAELLLRHCRRRFGGITGDVFGALAETATTTALIATALG